MNRRPDTSTKTSTRLTLTAEQQPDDVMYLRQAVVSDSAADGITFELDASGSTLLLHVKRDGKTIGRQRADLRPMLSDWLDAIIALDARS